MNKAIRFFCMMLALTMTLTILAGCGGKTNTPGGSSSVNSTVSTAKEDNSYKADFKGNKVIISCWVDIVPQLGMSELGDASYYAYEFAKTKHNATVEYKVLPDAEYNTQFVQASLSGSKFADIAAVHSNNHASWANQGLIKDVTDLMKDADPVRWDLEVSKFKDKLYGVNGKPAALWPNMFLLYNTEILTELNLESPQELDKKGQWTWDKLREYAKAAIKDKNSDGVIDRFGISSFMLPDAIRYNNDSISYVLVDGKYYNANTYSTTKQAFINSMDFLTKLSVQDKSVMGTVTGGMDVKSKGIEEFKNNNLLFNLSGIQEAMDMKSAKATNYAPVVFPKGPDSKGPNNYIPGYSFWGFSSASEYELKDLVAFWKDCSTTWNEDRGNAYYEPSKENEIGRVFESCFNSSADTEYLYEAGKKMKNISLYNGSLNYGGIEIFDMYQKIMKGEATAAAVIAATDGPLQAKIDEVLNSK